MTTELSERLTTIAKFIHENMDTPDKYSDVLQAIKDGFYNATDEQKETMQAEWNRLGI